MDRFKIQNPNRLVVALVVSNLFSALLLTSRIIFSDSTRYIFMYWNMLLAAIPALLGWWLVLRIKKYGWARPKQLILTAVWLAFLPNSFYLVTDFAHLRPGFEADILFDITMLASFMFNGLVLGFIGLFLVHIQLLQRMKSIHVAGVMLLVLLASSFAVYLGRFTRWNTWDLIFQPAGLLFDVSDRFINPGNHPQTFLITLVLFLFLATIYFVIYEVLRSTASSAPRAKQ